MSERTQAEIEWRKAIYSLPVSGEVYALVVQAIRDALARQSDDLTRTHQALDVRGELPTLASGGPGPLWHPISTVPMHKTVLLYRKDDLYPVVGWKQCDEDSGYFMLEEGGPEDSPHRVYPVAYPHPQRPPTHWAELPRTP